MKRFVDLKCCNSLEEAISLANQFGSFQLAERDASLNRPLEARCKNWSVKVWAISKASSVVTLVEKYCTAFEDKRSELGERLHHKMPTLDAKLKRNVVIHVSNPEMMDPDNLPRFPKDPQSGSRFSNQASQQLSLEEESTADWQKNPRDR